MHSKSLLPTAAIVGFAAALPAKSGSYAADQTGSLPGYSDADAPFGDYTPTPITVTPSSFGLDSQISAVQTSLPPPGAPDAGDTLRTLWATGHTNSWPILRVTDDDWSSDELTYRFCGLPTTAEPHCHVLQHRRRSCSTSSQPHTRLMAVWVPMARCPGTWSIRTLTTSPLL